jgi:tRNA threonylcarbamoyladenosine biosynthesis protein TsaB
LSSYILNIETATKNCSVALAKNGEVISFREKAGAGYSHAELLHVYIEDTLAVAGIHFKDLSAIAVSKGPGSYTGLRIGVSAAKGLCFALDIPLIAVDTLQSLAKQVKTDAGIIVPMLDARRMEVYSAVYDHHFNIIREVKAEIINENSFSEFISSPVYFVGDANHKVSTLLEKDNFIYLDDVLFPSAKEMCAASYLYYISGTTVDVAQFEPYYLKDFLMNS